MNFLNILDWFIFKAAFMSLITARFGNYAIVLVAAIFSFINCFWIALFVIFPESEQSKKESKENES